MVHTHKKKNNNKKSLINFFFKKKRHHRSDAYSSFVALIAIGGTYAGIPLFDPLGGILVSGMILKSGSEIMWSSSRELLD